MTKPASQESIKYLCENMNKVIVSSLKPLCDIIYTYIEIEKKIKQDNSNLLIWDLPKKLLELQGYLLYGSIVLSTFLRASFRSSSHCEKRLNLKYIVFITTELYKAINGKKGLWSKLRDTLYSDTLKPYITNIENELEKFNQDYNNKDYRDLAVHYDQNPIKVYDFIYQINEDSEVERVSAFLAITEAFNQLFRQLLLITFKDKNNISKDLTIINENVLGDKSGEIYSLLGEEILSIERSLSKIYHSYCLPKIVESQLGLSGFSNQFSDILDTTHLGIHIHLLYLDIATATRAYLSSESSVEKAIHLARLNLISYEGVKKIYSNDSESFWKKCIVDTISQKNLTTQNEIDNIDFLLSFTYSNGLLFDTEFRHNYAHVRRGKINELPLLFSKIQQLDALKELNRTLVLLRILPKIMQLNKVSLTTINKEFSAKMKAQHQKRMQDFYTLIDKIPLNDEQKSELLKALEKIDTLTDIKNNIKQ